MEPETEYQQMSGDEPKPTKKTTVSQTTSSVTLWLVICISHSLIGVFLMGYNTSLFNVPVDTIRANAAQSKIKKFEWEIVNAMFPVGALVGAAVSGRLADKIGRKKTMMINSIIYILASGITSTSMYYVQLVVGRFVTGIGSGVATVVCSAYLNEISPDNLRGAIGALLQFMITISIAVSEVLGKIYLEDPWWRIGCAVGGALCFIQLLLSCTLLESPKWLITQKRQDEAIIVAKKLRGLSYNPAAADIPMKQTLDEENSYNVGFTTIDDEINAQLIQRDDDNDFAPSGSLWTGLRQYRIIRYLFFVSLFLHMLQQLSGINAIFYYSTPILQDVGFNNVWLGSVLLAVANFIAVMLVTPFVDRWGRRKLLLLSSIGMVISSAAITFAFIYFKKNDGGDNESDWGIAVIVCMILFVMFFEFGLGPIPWIIVAEFTPIEYRGAMVSASQVINYGCNALIAATTETSLGALGVYGFVPFGITCAIGAVVIYFYVPETKQKTTKEIIDEMDPNYYANPNKYINE